MLSVQPVVDIRRQVVLDSLAENPWSTAAELSDLILKESGGAPVLLTGALWIPPWTLYDDLCELERRTLVGRRVVSPRRVWWATCAALASLGKEGK